jgi:hypothetical protein
MNYKNQGLVPSIITPELEEFMHRVEVSKIRGWLQNGNYWYPASIDSQCGYCNEWSNLVCSDPVFHPQSSSFVLHGRCVRCTENSRVFVDRVPKDTCNCDELWILPKPEAREEVFIEYEKTIPQRILRAYNTAIKSFNLGLWGGCITECGRALEGITRDKFPESIRLNKKEEEVHLGIKLQRLQTEAKKMGDIESLLKPIIELSEAVRLGRNTSAHFDVEKEPDKEAASLVLRLAEYLITYFYVIPKQAKTLEETIQSLLPADAEKEIKGRKETEEDED